MHFLVARDVSIDHFRLLNVSLGDTDSIFVKLPGRSVKEAFKFGREFCDAVTASNPPPVQLKLEKVYAGTLLQTVRCYDSLFVTFRLFSTNFTIVLIRKRSTVA